MEPNTATVDGFPVNFDYSGYTKHVHVAGVFIATEGTDAADGANLSSILTWWPFSFRLARDQDNTVPT